MSLLKSTPNIVVILCMIALIIAARSATTTHAEELLRSPSSIDPVLRHLPLEKERVRPDPTPGLDIPPARGKQTIILRPAHEKTNEPLAPLIALRIPSEFFVRPTDRPAEVFGLNLPVQYPSMAHYIEQFDSCRGWCEGKMRVSLESRRMGIRSAAASRVAVVREDIARQAKMAEPLVSFNSITPPTDYGEAIDVIYNKIQGSNRYERYFIRNDNNGAVAEFVYCYPKVPSPACTFMMPFPDQPLVQINYIHSMDLWEDRRKVQEAVLALVRKFYERAIAR